MIFMTDTQLAEVSGFAEAAYPLECCGLLAGSDHSGTEAETETGPDVRVTRVVPSDNLTQSDARDSFEVDPKVRFELMRALENSDERIIGHYHSHPDHPAEPSETDLSMVYEPEFYWLIASVSDHKTGEIRAFLPTPDASAFSPVSIQIIKAK